MTPDVLEAAERLSSALTKLPPYVGLVHRGVDLPPHVLDSYRPGAVVEERAFMSSSATPENAFPGNAQFVVQSASGRDISSLSQMPWEGEVLFDRGTRFRVLAHDIVDGTHRIVLREVPRAR